MKIIHQHIIKQILGFGILFLCSLTLTGQEIIDGYQNGRQIIGTKVEWNLDGETIWKDRDSSTYLYDSQQRLLKKENLYFNDTIWVAHSRTSLAYDVDGQGYVQTSQRWYADVFMENRQHIAEIVNEQNQLMSRVVSDWVNENWVNATKEDYIYDESGNTINITHYRFVNSEWILSWKDFFTFDELGQQTSNRYKKFNIIEFLVYESGDSLDKDTINGFPIINYWTLADGNWALKTRETNFFSTTNTLDSTLVQLRFRDTLEPYLKIIFNYNTANQLVQKNSFNIRDHKRQPYFTYNYTYDKNGYLILEDPLIWHQEADDFIEYEAGQKEWTYAEDGKLLKEVDYTGWAIEYGPGIAHSRNITYYANPISVTIPYIQTAYTFQIFPNPTRQFINIKGMGDIAFPLEMTVINLQGQILKQQKINTPSAIIGLSELPNGSYFIRLQDKFGAIQVKKVIKQ